MMKQSSRYPCSYYIGYCWIIHLILHLCFDVVFRLKLYMLKVADVGGILVLLSVIWWNLMKDFALKRKYFKFFKTKSKLSMRSPSQILRIIMRRKLTRLNSMQKLHAILTWLHADILIQQVSKIFYVFFFSFLRRYVDECDRIVSFKLKVAEKNAKKSQDNFEAALTEVLELEKIWQEVTNNLLYNTLRFKILLPLHHLYMFKMC